MTAQSNIRIRATAMLAGLAMLLTGCFITPGKFTSELELMEDNAFTFTYEGEIFFFGLSSLAQMGAAADEFVADECYNEETYESRECTEAELAEQRAEWEAGADIRAEQAKRDAEQMAAMMGGIDPSDPAAADELRQLLLRQKGWERVENKGDGVFDIRYSISGTLEHDFMFPMIEGFPTTNPFVQIILRDGEVVRVNAPGFSTQNDSNPMGSMMGGMAGMAGLAGLSETAPEGAGEIPNIPAIEGTFAIITSGQILANNTDEGPNQTPNGQALNWDISTRTTAAPTALIDMSR